MQKRVALTIGADEAGRRLDVLLAERHPELSRSRIQRLIGESRVDVNDRPVKAGYRVRAGDTVRMHVPASRPLRPQPEPIPLDIYYEDPDLMVVNKPRGMVVHPGAGHHGGTLVNALLHHCPVLSTVNGEVRPGIVHRLDKDTSGLLMVAKNDPTHLALSRQLRERTVTRLYLALVHGGPRAERGTVEAPVGRHPRQRMRMAVNAPNARDAVTHFEVLRRYRGYALLKLALQTGRTHQIRVHLAHLGLPVVGDPVYGRARRKLNVRGQFLHAHTLGFTHPGTGERLTFSAPLPAELQQILDRLPPAVI